MKILGGYEMGNITALVVLGEPTEHFKPELKFDRWYIKPWTN